MPLSAARICDLLKSGTIDFTVSAGSGDFYFQLAKLTGIANDASAPVPELSTLLLLGSGLAGLGGMAWRRHRRG